MKRLGMDNGTSTIKVGFWKIRLSNIKISGSIMARSFQY